MDFSSQSGTLPGPNNKLKWGLIIGALVVVVAAGAWYLAGAKTNLGGKVLGADTSTYQAVFLTNGQVYFGKLSDEGDWIQLTDIFYLQASQALQQTSTADQAKTATPTSTGTAADSSQNIQLIKLGSELHGPTDQMYIERDKVLFWENMKNDSKVVAAIKQYQAK